MNQISFSQAVDGYLLYAHSRRLSECTVADYSNTFRRFEAFLDPQDPPLADITLETVEAFLAQLDGLSKKTILNYHTGLSALWTWAVKRRIVEEHVVRQIDPPKPKLRQPRALDWGWGLALVTCCSACGESERVAPGPSQRPGLSAASGVDDQGKGRATERSGGEARRARSLV